MTLLEIKKNEIYNALMIYDGNKTKAAEHLQMSLRSLRDLTNHDPMFSKFKNESSNNHVERNIEMNEQFPAQKQNREMPEVFDTRNVVKKLENMMDKVTEKECTTETVHAACDCAGKITEILRLHIDLERLKIKAGR